MINPENAPTGNPELHIDAVSTEAAQIPPLFIITGPESGKGPDSGCNMTCSYCTPHGEGRTGGQERLSPGQLQDVLEDAYIAGVRTFRFTGGEPTLDLKLGENWSRP